MRPHDSLCVCVEVPATTANLGSGFDALGMALDLANTLEFRVSEAKGYRVYVEGPPGAERLPRDERHLAIQAALRFFAECGVEPPQGLELYQRIGIPLSGGLGSSATAVVGGILAASALSGVSWSVDRMLQLATAIEGHPDNVAPALLGGLVCSVRAESGAVYAVPVPVSAAWNLAVVLAVPDFELNTRDARAVLNEQVPLQDAVFNLGRAALFVAAAAAGRVDCLAESMKDRLHQPRRSSLIPGLEQVMEAALAAGALGVALSGAGPTVLALADPSRAGPVGESMRQAFLEAGVHVQVLHTRPRYHGATVRVQSVIDAKRRE